MELGVELISLAPSSKPTMFRRLDIIGWGREPGPLGEGRCLPVELADPIPGDAARLGGVARPKPESESIKTIQPQHNNARINGKQSKNHLQSSQKSRLRKVEHLILSFECLNLI
jgi:hypothetical protein